MWFTEDALTPCAIFGALGLIAVLSGLNAGRKSWAVLGILSGLVAGSAWLIDQAVVTEPERLETLVREVCEHFREKRQEVYGYFSDSAPELKLALTGALALVKIEDEPRLTDFSIKLTNQGTRATSHFRANATISVAGYGNVGHQPSRFILTWAREGDAWKIIKVQRLDPVSDRELGLLEQAAR